MQKLLKLEINNVDALLITTELDDSNVIIDLNNTILMVYLNHQGNQSRINKSAVGYDLYYFSEHIQNCIEGKINIPPELNYNIDLGLLWNQHWQKIALAEDCGNPLPTWKWIASDTVFLQNNSDGNLNCNTFLYQNEQSDIILQVSLAYPWFFKHAPSPELNISYDDWLPQYKILYKKIITREIAQKWVRQLNELYAKLDANMTFEK